MHTDKNIRDAFDRSVEKLETAGRAAHEKTTKEVLDELGRMRSNFRDVYNKLNSNGESLNSTVHDVVAQLRAELREVRVALADLAVPAPPPLTTPPSPASAEQEAPGPEGDRRDSAAAPVTTLTESDGHPEDSALRPAIPEQRSAEPEPDSPPSPELPVDVVRQALRDVLTDELAPVLTALTTPVSTDDGPAGNQQDASDRVREAVGEIKQEVGTALAEARSALASLHRPRSQRRRRPGGRPRGLRRPRSAGPGSDQRMTTTTPACGCDQTVFRCGRCGIEHTATTETDYLKAVGVHGDAHLVWDRLNPIERDGLASILRTILSAPELTAELLALADRQPTEGESR
ncbi:hypothetical protein [Streptomyces sp. NPDC023327]|uniref:hypothetical protein n=1 Tax=Streptomyces sp. NPDC023327 TaxID=3157088 RepID=UPI0033DE365F